MSRGNAARGRRTAQRKKAALANKQQATRDNKTEPELSDDEFLADLAKAMAAPINDVAPVEQLTIAVPDEWADIAALADDGDGPDQEPDSDEPMSGQCSCGHMANAHVGDMNDGACSMGDCECMAFKPTSEQAAAEDGVLVAAAGDMAWGPEQGFQDLLNDLAGQLGDDWWVNDVTVDLSKALICHFDDGASGYWVAPISMDGAEPVLSARNEWVEVEPAWIEADDPYQGRGARGSKDAAPSYALSFTATNTNGAWTAVPGAWYANGWSSWPVTFTAGQASFELTPDMIKAPEQGQTVLPSGTIEWTAVLAPEGQATDDGRVFAPGSIEWRELPLSLMGMTKTADGHDGAEVCGRIDRIWRDEASGLIMGQGEFDTGEFGAEIARLVADGTLRGLSVDIAVSEMEVAARSDVVDDAGVWLTEPAANAEEDDGEEKEAPSLLDVLFGDDGDSIFVVKKGIIGAATVCPFPAFAQAKIEVGSSITAGGAPNVWTVSSQAGWRLAAGGMGGEPAETPEAPEGAPEAVLTASAAGLVAEAPPAAWFEPPGLEQLTPLTVDDDGRVYGHAAPWDQCHIGLPGGCTTAPASATNYAYFLLKEIVAEGGERVPVGTITLDTGHAAQSLGRAQATRHYDDTGTAVADVNIGEDEHGIWVAGALRPDVDADKARKVRGAALSGDWRDVNGNLELVALLAVNVPGFPVPRPTAALVASGDGFEVATLLSNAPVTAETVEALAQRHRQDAEVSSGFAEIAETIIDDRAGARLAEAGLLLDETTDEEGEG